MVASRVYFFSVAPARHAVGVLIAFLAAPLVKPFLYQVYAFLGQDILLAQCVAHVVSSIATQAWA